MRAGPRSNFSMLPSLVRFRMILLLDDGATFDAVSADPEVAEAYRSRGLALTRSSVSRIKGCKEYKEVVEKRRKQQLGIRADQLTTALLRDSHALETVSDRVKVELMKAVRIFPTQSLFGQAVRSASRNEARSRVILPRSSVILMRNNLQKHRELRSFRCITRTGSRSRIVSSCGDPFCKSTDSRNASQRLSAQMISKNIKNPVFRM